MFGLGVNRLGATNQKPFSPSSLFNNGEAGVWYDPSAASGSLDWRKNLLEYTESFDNSAWVKSGSTVTANDTTAPDGTTTADKIVFAAASCQLFQDFSSISGATASIYIKGTAGQTIKFGVQSAEELFTLTGGWDRLTKSTTGSTARVTVNTYGGATARTIYVWGAQLEEASTASSYQPILSTFANAFKAAFPSHTLYQDSQGVTPVTAVGQPVGLMLDKSEGLAQGPELVTNGDFSNGTNNWNAASSGVGTIVDGQLVITSTQPDDNAYAFSQSMPVVAGKFYKVSGELVAYTGSNMQIRVGASNTSSSYGVIESNSVGTGFKSIVVQPTSSILFITLYGFGPGDSATFDNVSVTELQGSHATQPTSTKRPIYARHPEGGIRNLLNYTEQFDNGYWSKGADIITPNAAIAPDGTQTADKFVAANNNSTHEFNFGNNFGTSVFVQSIYAKAGEYSFLFINGVGNSDFTWFNLFNGTVETVSSLHSNVTMTPAGDGWYRCSVTVTGSNAGAGFGASAVNGLYAYQGNGTSGIYMWGAQLEEATEASNYQKRVTDIDVTESGVGEVYYLKFDGVDDGMQINNLTSSSTPKTALFGYSSINANDSRAKYLIDIESGRTVFAASANTAGYVGYYDGAWAQFDTDAKAIKVLTYDLVEDNAKIRIDGTQEYSDTTYDQQAISGAIALFTAFDSDAQCVGGNMYQTILRAAESTDEEIAKAETYVANKTGLKAQVDGIATLDLNFGNNTYTAKNSNGGVI